jgi:hypothetical protein
MEMRSLAMIALYAALSALCPAAADALTARVIPAEVSPGDPYVVEVLGAIAPEVGREAISLPLMPCGEGCVRAIGAVDLTMAPGTVSLSVRDGSVEVPLTLTVLEAEFPIQRITLPREQVELGPEDRARADREALALDALWQVVTPPAITGQFIMPLSSGISTAFGATRIMNGSVTTIHRGLDLRGAEGTPIKAANSGRVVYIEDTFYGGNTVAIDHGLGVHTLYMHLSSVRVTLNESVAKGQIIGSVGATGRVTGPHLHYGVKVSGASTNPIALTKLPL